jgi:branched-chain amino acid transport system ATP-binding protein
MSMSPHDVLVIDDLVVQFGGLRAIDGFSLSVSEGELVGLIGPNGSGKTTLFNAITGVVPMTSGSIQFRSKDLNGLPSNRIATLGISRTFQNIRIFPRMTVLQNVALAIHRIPSYSVWEAFLRTRKVVEADKKVESEAYEFLEALGLTEYAKREAGTLPYGLQRKVEIARALATRPGLLLLDEPAAGMNDQECLQLQELIREIHDRYKLSTILIEHHMTVVAAVCQRLIVLNLGKMLAQGAVRDIQSDPRVIQAYLGERRSRDA